MREDCKQTIGIDCLERIAHGVLNSGENRQLSDPEIKQKLLRELSKA